MWKLSRMSNKTVTTVCVSILLLLLWIKPKLSLLLRNDDPAHYDVGRSIEINQHYGEQYFRNMEQKMLAPDTVVYNKIPRCASVPTIMVMGHVARTSHTFRMESCKHSRKNSLSRNAQRQLARKLQEIQVRPLLYEQHMYFLNFTSFGMDMPLYINIIRNPLDILVSQFYYEQQQDIPDERLLMRLDRPGFANCISGNFSSCDYSAFKRFSLIQYFCGQDASCAGRSFGVFRRAVINLERYYGVVGLQEDLFSTFSLLDRTMPHYFHGLHGVAKKYSHILNEASININKGPQPTREIRRHLIENVYWDMKFYEYVKNRYIQFLEYFQIDSPLRNQTLSR